MLLIPKILLFVILCVILPQLMYIGLVGFVSYIMCKAMKKKSIGQMIVLLCIFVSLNLIIGKTKPMIDKVYEGKQSIESIQKAIDEIEGNDSKEEVKPTRKVWDFLNKYPNEGCDK